MTLQKFKSDIIKIHNYCLEHSYAFLPSIIQVLQLQKKHDLPLWFIINCDLLNSEKCSSVMLQDEYIAKAVKLNGADNLVLLNDKSVLIKRCSHLFKRDTLLLDEATPKEIDLFFSKHTKFVAKRNFLSCASGFCIYDQSKMSLGIIKKLIKLYGQTILEEFIVQHDDITKIYQHSVNTIRIHTISNGTGIKICLPLLMRFGADGAVVDSVEPERSKNCYALILDNKGSVLIGIRITSDNRIIKVTEHHNTHASFIGLTIPYILEAQKLCIKAAHSFPELKYIAWDIAITSDGPMIVEGNCISGTPPVLQAINCVVNGQGLKRELNEMFEYAGWRH